MTTETITLEQMLQTYRHLTAEFQTGRMTPEQFAGALAGLQGVDGAGYWWGVQADGKFWMHDGTRWVQAWPPGLPPPAPVAQPSRLHAAPAAPQSATQVPRARAAAQPAQPIQSRPAATGMQGILAASPILAVLPSLLCGGLWFLYTFIGLLKSEGIQGVDWLTPLIVGGIPIVLWIFKKPIDKLLLPLRPAIVTLAKPLRMGIVMAVPMLMGCMCSTLMSSGYLGLNISSFISVMAAAILMRY